jgi:hypothetical protein
VRRPGRYVAAPAVTIHLGDVQRPSLLVITQVVAKRAPPALLSPRVRHWTLTTLRDKLLKIGAKMRSKQK